MGKNNGNILGIKYIAHDTSAALLQRGKLVAACEQERYSLDKHSRKFPIDAINDCLHIGGITMDDVDMIAFGGDPIACLRQTYLKPALGDIGRVGMIVQEVDRIRDLYSTDSIVRSQTGFQGDVRYYDHHLAHLASSYYPSGFSKAIVLSIDGIGDNKTMKLALGRNGGLDVVQDAYDYPNSLGLTYAAITCYLGWKPIHHEGIIMALACYGDPFAKVPGGDRTYHSYFEEIIQYDGEYGIAINQDWMSYYYVRDKWVSDRFVEVFGPRRQYNLSTLDQHHMNIAAALQKRLEDVVIGVLIKARKDYGIPYLCMAGGLALNCSMNGKIEKTGLFDEIFVQPASGDAGLAIGACYLAQAELVSGYSPEKNHNYYLGASFTNDEIESALKNSGMTYTKPENLFEKSAVLLGEGKVVAWFQGGSEFGPRALGNRSILARPYPAEMKDHINNKVKFREYFRPLAPAVLSENLYEYFDIRQESPHMLLACKVKPGKKNAIPATVHVDDSCRVQSVSESNNRRFYRLLKAFHAYTGCPVLLNTSFNVQGQPIVNTPDQAIDCFRSTRIDALVFGDFITEK